MDSGFAGTSVTVQKPYLIYLSQFWLLPKVIITYNLLQPLENAFFLVHDIVERNGRQRFVVGRHRLKRSIM